MKKIDEGTVDEESFLTVSEIAKRLKVKESWVYGHSNELGAIHLGKYLRFYWPHVVERLGRQLVLPSTAAVDQPPAA